MNKDIILLAVEKGYRVTEDGDVYGPSGRKLSLRIAGKGTAKYKHFSVKMAGGSVYPVKVHRLVAFFKFGEKSFEKGTHTRHLNGDSMDNSFENIGIGSASKNAHDRPKVDRRYHAQKAGRSGSLSDETWDEIRRLNDAGVSYRQLAESYGVAKSTLSFRLSKTAKRQVMALPPDH